ncbi:crasp-1ss outer surface protein (plasmid) [Borreliella garinii Far04]|nr:crasp-1ss outer surface protein [Borreliella garinii Far04]
MNLDSNLKTRQNFAKKLNETIKAYNKNLYNIKNNIEELAWHIDANYKTLDSFKSIN